MSGVSGGASHKGKVCLKAWHRCPHPPSIATHHPSTQTAFLGRIWVRGVPTFAILQNDPHVRGQISQIPYGAVVRPGIRRVPPVIERS